MQRPHSIRTRLIWLIAVSVLPLLALSGWLAASRAEAERQGIEARRFDLVNNLTFLIEREISHIEGVLLGLSTSPELGSGDFATFRRQAETVVASAELGVIAVLDKTGQQLVSTDLADGQPLPKRDDLTPIQAAFDGQNVVSQLTEGTASKRPVILITIPVRRDGQIVYALSAGLFPERLTKLFAEAGIPVNWTSAVVDRNGRFIARNLNPQQYIGKLARPELGRAAIGIANVGEFDNVNLEGIKTANSFRRSTITGWTSVVSVPKSVLNAPLYRTTTIFLLGAGALS